MRGCNDIEKANKAKAGVDDAGLRAPAGGAWRVKFAAFAAIAIAWFIADRVTKALVDNGINQAGAVVGNSIAELFRVHLVYNTGGAWSIFAGATFVLGAFSVLMCATLITFAVVQRAHITWLEIIGLALVVSGGLGNAVDRFLLGHVVDFIDLAFIDFPVFNVADIGVTCGIVVFLIGFLWRQRSCDESRVNEGGR